ncbi:MAG TPA: hypothetical protein VLQ93_09260 [Myxococcaceae bacterium]|nr:hypothetical protein [Myxococcaceae bacterium]
MRALRLCLVIGLTSPARANSLEDTLCGTRSLPVAQMVTSEKLCRSFALGLAKVPDAASQEAQALLTPENLATMTALTGIWLASQGVPVVGEAVDAALATLGIILLAAQAADLSMALWQYAHLTTMAQSREELKAASAHLAHAIALVGINVVTFILTTKVSSRARRQPPPREPTARSSMELGTPLAESSIRTIERGGSPNSMAANHTKPSSAQGSRHQPLHRWFEVRRRRPVHDSRPGA